MKAFVLGHPIEHSLSPALHHAAYDFLAVDIAYDRWDTTQDQLAARFGDVLEQEKICGYSVTMPLKKSIFDYMDQISPFARRVGAINTVYFRDCGGHSLIVGHNTDVAGIVNALQESAESGKRYCRAAILGGGGTAASALMAFSELGVLELDIYVRSVARAQAVRALGEKLDLPLNFLPLEDFAEAASTYDTVVSTLPAGAADVFASQMSASYHGVLLDVSYSPWPSELAKAWWRGAGQVISGKEMLLYQAVEQIKFFTDSWDELSIEQELELLNYMARAIDLPDRQKVPTYRSVAE